MLIPIVPEDSSTGQNNSKEGEDSNSTVKPIGPNISTKKQKQKLHTIAEYMECSPGWTGLHQASVNSKNIQIHTPTHT